MDDPDRAVLARVADGDIEAFEALVMRHERRLVGLCGRMLGDHESGRDAAQEVFLKAFRNAGTFRPRARVSTWLYRIAVNHCLNRLRRRRVVRFLTFSETTGREGDGDAGAPLLLDPPDDAPSAERALAARRRWQALRARIDRLPPGQRAALVLVRLEGMRYREAAEVLGISVGAVESRLVRAMRRLAAQETRVQGVSPSRGRE